MPNFSGYLFGETGVFKSTIAVLMLSHFGDFDSITNLSNLSDTSNSLVRRAFTLGDTLMVLDDYHPSSRRTDAQQKETTAQSLIRSFSNRTGKGRLNPDATEKPRLEPRGMLVITGEELVTLQSTLARVFVVEISKGDIKIDSLTQLQDRADLLPHAMASYILWVKDNLPSIRKRFKQRFNYLRGLISKRGYHPKLAEQVAFLQFAVETALSWMHEKGAINENEVRLLKLEANLTFRQSIAKQNQRFSEEDPVNKFKDILKSLLSQGKIRLDKKDGTGLVGPLSGDLIGYYDDKYVYLIPPVTWNTVNRFCNAEGSHFPLSKATFYTTLKKRGLIETSKDGNNTVTVRINGKAQKVLKWLGLEFIE